MQPIALPVARTYLFCKRRNPVQVGGRGCTHLRLMNWVRERFCTCSDLDLSWLSTSSLFLLSLSFPLTTWGQRRGCHCTDHAIVSTELAFSLPNHDRQEPVLLADRVCSVSGLGQHCPCPAWDVQPPPGSHPPTHGCCSVPAPSGLQWGRKHPRRCLRYRGKSQLSPLSQQ